MSLSLLEIRKMIAPLRRKIANLAARGVVKLVDDTDGLQLLQLSVLDSETRNNVERFQQYGFTSVPKEGAESVVLFVGGNREHGLAIAVEDRRYRIRNLESGEVAIYTDEGDSIVIRRGGTVEVTAASKVTLASPSVELAGNSDAALKGTSYASAESTFLDAVNTYAAAVQAVADPSHAATTALAAAVTAFKAATTSALSSKVKLA